MPVEIERKFLVSGDTWRQSPGVRIRQGYLTREKDRTVRVRVFGGEAALTVKGPAVGASRAEFEYKIPLADGEELLKLCEGPFIEKIRRTLREGEVAWEVDEFLGENAGLVIAEVELQSEAQTFASPTWLGDEVTHDPRYFNSNLATHPYRKWRAQQQG